MRDTDRPRREAQAARGDGGAVRRVTGRDGHTAWGIQTTRE